MLPPDHGVGTESSRLYLTVPKPMQTEQRAELWRVIAALQASRPIHLRVGRIIVNKAPTRPFEFLVDGDLLALVKMLIKARCLELLLSPRLKVMRMRV